MKIKTELLRADGYSEDEIKQIQEHCKAALVAGRFSQDAALIWIKGSTQFCCRTIAEILDKVRPGCWLDNPAKHKRKKATKHTEEKQSDGLIKVHYAFPCPRPGWPSGEFLVARQIGKNTAKIESIPFGTGQLACGDLFRINKNNEVTAILEHVAKTRSLIYATKPEKSTSEEIAERYAEVRAKLKEHDIYTEGMFPGVCSISVPKDIDDDELESIAAGVGAKVIVHDDKVQHG